MNKTISTVYERGVLRPLTPLSLPERTRVEIKIVAQSTDEDERQRVRRVLLDAGVIRLRSQTELVQPISEEQLLETATVLAEAGPLSELIIAERDGR